MVLFLAMFRRVRFRILWLRTAADARAGEQDVADDGGFSPITSQEALENILKGRLEQRKP